MYDPKSIVDLCTLASTVLTPVFRVGRGLFIRFVALERKVKEHEEILHAMRPAS